MRAVWTDMLFQTMFWPERLHVCSLANPLTSRVQSKSIHTLPLVYIMLCSIALTSHFPLGSSALCAVKLTLDMSLSVDEDRYYVPLRSLFPLAPCSHTWRRKHMAGENMMTEHVTPLGFPARHNNLKTSVFIRSVRSETGVCRNTSQNRYRESFLPTAITPHLTS